ncbi:MAG: T9SS type A sorting domain-containing protein, partial [Gemmatimonadota bacterium]|nr:T9SS type A sorting domain-containing protein [Gemmatimonadota bacterium]
GFHAMEANATMGTILAGAMDGLWRSTDDGNTWIDVKTGDDYYDVKWKPGDPNTVYTVKGSSASGNNVKISTDDGLTWAKAGTGQPSSWTVGKSKIAVTAANPDYIYALYSENSSNGGTTGVYRSTDGGSTWTQRSGANPNIGGGQGWYNLILAADPNNADRIIAGGVRLYRSTNGGTGYSQIGNWVHVDYHAVRYEPGSNSNLWVANDGGIYRSQNDGTSWTDLNNGLVTFQFYDICVAQSSPTIAVGGSQDNGTDKWTGTSNWTYILGGDGMVCNVKPTSANVIYAELYYGDHRKTSNGGTGWSQINSGITGTGAWVAPVDEDQVTPNHLYTSSSDGIFRTLNGGSNWTNVGGQTATWISISPVDGNVVWTAGSGVYQTTDDGGSWTQASPYGFSTGGVTKILAHPTDTNSAIVVFSGYGDGTSHIALTTDSGSTWTDKSSNFPSQPVNAIAVDWSNTDHWFIGTDVGVWASLDAGGSWSPFETGLPNVVVSDLEIHRSGGKLVAGTYGRGMWEVDITSMSTGVETGVQAGPRNLMLDAPWPNPVTDQATLRFAAKYAGVVTLDIHDVAGRLVSRVAEIPAGDGLIRMADWLTDDVPSGVYFAVLKAGEERISRKLIVTR